MKNYEKQNFTTRKMENAPKYAPEELIVIDDDDDLELEITFVGPSVPESSVDSPKSSNYLDLDEIFQPYQKTPIQHQHEQPTPTIKLTEFEPAKPQKLNQWLTLVKHSKVQSPITSPKVTEKNGESSLPQPCQPASECTTNTLSEKKDNTNPDPSIISAPELPVVSPLSALTSKISEAKPVVMAPEEVPAASVLVPSTPKSKSSGSKVQALCPSSLREGSSVKAIVIPAPDAVPKICLAPGSTSSHQTGSSLPSQKVEGYMETVPRAVVPTPSSSLSNSSARIAQPQRFSSPIVIRNTVPATQHIRNTDRNAVSKTSVRIPSQLPPSTSVPPLQQRRDTGFAHLWNEGAETNNGNFTPRSNDLENESQDLENTKRLIKSLSEIVIEQKAESSPTNLEVHTIYEGVAAELIPIGIQDHSVDSATFLDLFKSPSLDPPSSTTSNQLMTFYSSNSNEAESDLSSILAGSRVNNSHQSLVPVPSDIEVNESRDSPPLSFQLPISATQEQILRDMSIQPILNIPLPNSLDTSIQTLKKGTKGSRKGRALMSSKKQSTELIPTSMCMQVFEDVNKFPTHVEGSPKLQLSPSLPSFSASFMTSPGNFSVPSPSNYIGFPGSSSQRPNYSFGNFSSATWNPLDVVPNLQPPNLVQFGQQRPSVPMYAQNSNWKDATNFPAWGPEHGSLPSITGASSSGQESLISCTEGHRLSAQHTVSTNADSTAYQRKKRNNGRRKQSPATSDAASSYTSTADTTDSFDPTFIPTPRRKYVRKKVVKFDADGNPIKPEKQNRQKNPEVDDEGNIIPKPRRKPRPKKTSPSVTQLGGNSIQNSLNPEKSTRATGSSGTQDDGSEFQELYSLLQPVNQRTKKPQPVAAGPIPVSSVNAEGIQVGNGSEGNSMPHVKKKYSRKKKGEVSEVTSTQGNLKPQAQQSRKPPRKTKSIQSTFDKNGKLVFNIPSKETGIKQTIQEKRKQLGFDPKLGITGSMMGFGMNSVSPYPYMPSVIPNGSLKGITASSSFNSVQPTSSRKSSLKVELLQNLTPRLTAFGSHGEPQKLAEDMPLLNPNLPTGSHTSSATATTATVPAIEQLSNLFSEGGIYVSADAPLNEVVHNTDSTSCASTSLLASQLETGKGKVIGTESTMKKSPSTAAKSPGNGRRRRTYPPGPDQRTKPTPEDASSMQAGVDASSAVLFSPQAVKQYGQLTGLPKLLPRLHGLPISTTATVSRHLETQQQSRNSRPQASVPQRALDSCHEGVITTFSMSPSPEGSTSADFDFGQNVDTTKLFQSLVAAKSNPNAAMTKFHPGTSILRGGKSQTRRKSESKLRNFNKSLPSQPNPYGQKQAQIAGTPLPVTPNTDAVLFKTGEIGGNSAGTNLFCIPLSDNTTTECLMSPNLSIQRLLSPEAASLSLEPWKNDCSTLKANRILSLADLSQNKAETELSIVVTKKDNTDTSAKAKAVSGQVLENENGGIEIPMLGQAEATVVAKVNYPKQGEGDVLELEKELTTIRRSLETTSLEESPDILASDSAEQPRREVAEAKEINARASGRRISRRTVKYVAPGPTNRPQPTPSQTLKVKTPVLKITRTESPLRTVKNPGYGWTFSEDELAFIFQDGSFIMKRTDLILETEKLTIWRVMDSGGSTLKLKAYEPNSKRNSNRWFHISNWIERMGDETREFGAETITLEKNLRHIFANYLPVYVDKICDSPEISVVKLYRDERYFPHIPNIYKMEDLYKENFYNFVRTLVYYAMNPKFFENVINADLEFVSAEVHQLRTGWFETIKLIRTKCKSFAGSPRWASCTVLLPILKYPKMTLSSKNCDKERNCTGCENTVRPLHLPAKSVTFDGLSYDYDTLMPNPEGHPANGEKPNPDFQFCHSCTNFLKSFHSLYHMPYHVLATIIFRLETMHWEFPQDAIFDSLSVKRALDADIDWYKWLLLDFLVCYSQIQMHMDQMGRCAYIDASHEPSEM